MSINCIVIRQLPPHALIMGEDMTHYKMEVTLFFDAENYEEAVEKMLEIENNMHIPTNMWIAVGVAECDTV